jgi:hypothetical protein
VAALARRQTLWPVPASCGLRSLLALSLSRFFIPEEISRPFDPDPECANTNRIEKKEANKKGKAARCLGNSPCCVFSLYVFVVCACDVRWNRGAWRKKNINGRRGNHSGEERRGSLHFAASQIESVSQTWQQSTLDSSNRFPQKKIQQ